MLYLLLGGLLEKASEAVDAGFVHGDGEYASRQQRRLAVLLMRLGRLSAQLPRMLHDQNEVLSRALDAAVADGAARGIDLPPVPEQGTDPLRWHLELLSAIDHAISMLHRRVADELATDILRRLREELSAVTAIEATVMRTVIGETPRAGSTVQS
jgi:hypothetical protein